MQTRSFSRSRTAAVAAVVWTLSGCGGTAAPIVQPNREARAEPAVENEPLVRSDTSMSQAVSLEEAFTTVASAVSPAVVSIRVEGRGSQVPPEALEEFARRFGLSPGEMPERRVPRGEGSGVVIRENGFILTNNHVVDGAARIDVTLQDRRRFVGRVVGRDPASDLAVVRIDATGLTAARFASADDVRPGQWALAIGSPLGLDYTVTTGVVSAVGRGGLGVNEIEDYVQTDASINPGNSGGPLVNLRGEVIGVNTMIAGIGTGIGFAVPSDVCQRVADEIISSGSVRRAYLGVGFQELTPELRTALGVAADVRGGALVSNVPPASPSARAGVKAGDVVVSIDGAPVAEGRDLLRAVLAKRVGDRVSLRVIRNGQEVELVAVLGERPHESAALPAEQPPPVQASPEPAIGLEVGPNPNGHGALVTRVAPSSAAARAGIRRGDIVLEADGASVAHPRAVDLALADGSALLRMQRGAEAFFAVVTSAG
jgi:serine protease Do